MRPKGLYFFEQISPDESEHLKKEFLNKRSISITGGSSIELNKFVLGYNSGILQLFQRNGAKENHRIITQRTIEAEVAYQFISEKIREYRSANPDRDYLQNFEF